jgi:site-specific recombinase XerD
MKENDFPKYLSDFLSKYLPGQRNASTHTIASYRDVFKLLLIFCDSTKSIKPEKIKTSDLSKELILHFLDWLETERKCSISTRNQRLAVIHSFVHYVVSADFLSYEENSLIGFLKTFVKIMLEKCLSDVKAVFGVKFIVFCAYLSISGQRLATRQTK